MSTQATPRPPELPDLGEELRAAAATAMAAYDLPTARLRLQERLRSEGRRATTHRRWVVAVAAAVAVVLVGADALRSHHPDARPNPPVAPRPSASSTPTAAGIPVGIWRADASHFDEGNYQPTFVFLTVRPTPPAPSAGTGSTERASTSGSGGSTALSGSRLTRRCAPAFCCSPSI